jgi:hypothetical protein
MSIHTPNDPTVFRRILSRNVALPLVLAKMERLG